MKKILFISAFPPCNKTAGQGYSYQLLKDLAARGHEIDLIYSEFGDHVFDLPNSNIKTLKVYRTNVLLKLLNCLKFVFFHPFFTSRFRFRTLFHLVRKAHQYDLIYLDFSQVFIFSLFIKHPKVYLMVHDIISQKYKRENGILRAVTVAWVFFTEKVLLQKKQNHLLCFSNKDERMLGKLFRKPAEVVSIYLDKQIETLKTSDLEEKDFFCFFGAWNRKENLDGLIWFFDNVAPQLPDKIKFIVIGGGIPSSLPPCMLKENIRITGFIENPYQIIAGAKALIAPIFQGAGVKFKVLEAFACGTPVIGTDIAFEGISPLMKHYMIKCKEREEYISAVKAKWEAGMPLEEKEQLRENFLRSYAVNKFSNLLSA